MGLINIKHINTTGRLGLWSISESLSELITEIHSFNNSYEISSSINQNRNKQWIATRLLLQKMLPGSVITYAKNGAPKISTQEISISHCKEWVIIALQNGPIGIDIERISSKPKKVAKKFLTQREQAILVTDEDYTIAWSIKEALYKLNLVNIVSYQNQIQLEQVYPSIIGKVVDQNKSFTIHLKKEKRDNFVIIYTHKIIQNL